MAIVPTVNTKSFILDMFFESIVISMLKVRDNDLLTPLNTNLNIIIYKTFMLMLGLYQQRIKLTTQFYLLYVMFTNE